MNIALVKVDTNHEFPPLGILSVGSALKRAGFDVTIYHTDWRHAMFGTRALVDQILSRNPLYIGFSVTSGDPMDALTTTIREVHYQSPETPVVLGGVHPSLLPISTLRDPCGVDYVVQYNGESRAVQLAQCLSTGTKPTDIPGILRFSYPIPTIPDPKTILPNDWSLLDTERYIHPYRGLNRVLMGVVLSRGCPHDCTFCYNAAFHKRRWLKPNPATAANEINKLARDYDLDGVMIHDDNMTTDKLWSMTLLNFLSVPAAGIKGRIDEIHAPFLDTAERNGTRVLYCGIESGCDKTLKLLGKKFTVKTVKSNLLHFRNRNLIPKLSFMFGLPNETRRDIQDTLDLINWTIDTVPQASFQLTRYLPYPGASLTDILVQSGDFKMPRTLLSWNPYKFGLDYPAPWTDVTENDVKKWRWLVHGARDSRLRTVYRKRLAIESKLPKAIRALENGLIILRQKAKRRRRLTDEPLCH